MFGIVGSDVQSPFDIKFSEFILLVAPTLLCSYSLLLIFGTENLFCVIYTSAVSTGVAFCVRAIRRSIALKSLPAPYTDDIHSNL